MGGGGPCEPVTDRSKVALYLYMYLPTTNLTAVPSGSLSPTSSIHVHVVKAPVPKVVRERSGGRPRVGVRRCRDGIEGSWSCVSRPFKIEAVVVADLGSASRSALLFTLSRASCLLFKCRGLSC